MYFKDVWQMKWDRYDVHHLKKNHNHILCYTDNYLVDGSCLVNEETEYFLDFPLLIRPLRVTGAKTRLLSRYSKTQIQRNQFRLQGYLNPNLRTSITVLQMWKITKISPLYFSLKTFFSRFLHFFFYLALLKPKW